jgi:hypothetical protein
MNRRDRLRCMLVRKLTTWRNEPPTVASLLLSSWSTLTLFAGGVLLGVLAPTVRDVLGPVPLLLAGIFLGAAIRDLGIDIRAVRFWPIQQELLDWPKIEVLAQGMADGRSE